MLLVDVHVGPSRVHGLGIFAKSRIACGEWLWEFMDGVDSRKSPLLATQDEMHYGFISNLSGLLVTCGDNARLWNFGVCDNNCAEISVSIDGEYVVAAIKDIEAGDELLISVASDADAKRKLMLE